MSKELDLPYWEELKRLRAEVERLKHEVDKAERHSLDMYLQAELLREALRSTEHHIIATLVFKDGDK